MSNLQNSNHTNPTLHPPSYSPKKPNHSPMHSRTKDKEANRRKSMRTKRVKGREEGMHRGEIGMARRGTRVVQEVVWGMGIGVMRERREGRRGERRILRGKGSWRGGEGVEKEIELKRERCLFDERKKRSVDKGLSSSIDNTLRKDCGKPHSLIKRDAKMQEVKKPITSITSVIYEKDNQNFQKDEDTIISNSDSKDVLKASKFNKPLETQKDKDISFHSKKPKENSSHPQVNDKDSYEENSSSGSEINSTIYNRSKSKACSRVNTQIINPRPIRAIVENPKEKECKPSSPPKNPKSLKDASKQRMKNDKTSSPEIQKETPPELAQTPENPSSEEEYKYALQEKKEEVQEREPPKQQEQESKQALGKEEEKKSNQKKQEEKELQEELERQNQQEENKKEVHEEELEEEKQEEQEDKENEDQEEKKEDVSEDEQEDEQEDEKEEQKKKEQQPKLKEKNMQKQKLKKDCKGDYDLGKDKQIQGKHKKRKTSNKEKSRKLQKVTEKDQNFGAMNAIKENRKENTEEEKPEKSSPKNNHKSKQKSVKQKSKRHSKSKKDKAKKRQKKAKRMQDSSNSKSKSESESRDVPEIESDDEQYETEKQLLRTIVVGASRGFKYMQNKIKYIEKMLINKIERNSLEAFIKVLQNLYLKESTKNDTLEEIFPHPKTGAKIRQLLNKKMEDN
ncbi:unnamed protein product [Moneuplotes crassus]|uniref:Uncharacterized protein n=1 Tax=Euplotes crassus TaxID=5936 RepID=A0AAD2DBW3_EUPCR|nr:unnamed protein product [Moneuplotes crassus]